MKLHRIFLLFVAAAVLAFAACSQQPDVASMSDEEFETYAAEVHAAAYTIDTHVDIPGGRYATEALDPGSEDAELRCSLPKMEKGGLDGVFLAVYVGQRGGLDEEGYARAYDQAIEKFTAIHRLAKEMYPDRCALATSPEEFKKVAESGKRAILIGIENGYPIGEDLSRVKEFYDLGTRYITLSHSGHNQICDSSGPREPMHGGVSEFGEKVIAEMNRLGIMIDVSHIADASYSDVIELSKAPIIASHSGCRALSDVGRNLTDEQLKALAENGGVIQIVALERYLDTESTSTFRQAANEARQKIIDEMGVEMPSRRELYSMSDEERAKYDKINEEIEAELEPVLDELRKTTPHVNIGTYVDHIDHAVEIAGIDHVGIGTDFDGGGGFYGFEDHSECLNVTKEMLKRGYTEEQVKMIWGGNLLRVWSEVENVARELQAAAH